MKTQRKLVTAIVEDAYGDGKAATATVRAMNLKPTLLNTSKIEKPTIKPGFGHDAVVQAGANVALEFEMDLAGSGVAGTAPGFGELLRGCGFSETISAGTSVTYDPISENQDSLSIFYYHDGDLHQLKGARGDVSLNLQTLDKPTLKFNFTGIYVPVSAASLPASAFAPSADVLPVSKSTTGVMTLDGENLALSQLELSVGNTVVYRNLVNKEEVNINDRKSTLKAQFDRPNVASKDWFASVMNGDSGPLNITHGSVAGNIVQISAGKVQPTEVADADNDGQSQLDMTARLLSPSGSGDDEFSLIFT